MRVVITGLLSISCFAAGLVLMQRAYADERTAVSSVTQEAATEPATPATTVWKQRRLSGSVLYFLDGASARLRRFDFATTSWLSDIALDGDADSFAVDATGIYVKFANRVENVALDGSSRSTIPSVVGERPFIEVVGNYLFLGRQDNMSTASSVVSYNKVTGALVSSRNTSGGFGGPSAIDAEGRLFGARPFVTPGDIVVLEFNPGNGSIFNSFDSPYHGRYPDPTTTYARQEGGMVIVNSGTVFNASTLQYLGSLGGPVQAVAYLADSFVVMRGGKLAVFSNDIRELGQLDAPVDL